MATFYIDPENGNDANAGTSFALAWKTIKTGATAARIAPGDVIRIKKSPDPTSIGSCTWTDTSRNLTIPANVIKDVDMGESSWTASANVTCTTSATRKQGNTSSSHAIGAGFGTGLASYKALGAATDFSGYQQLSFWIRSSAAITAGTYRINLCSDAAGATPVDSFDIPAIPVANTWHAYTVNKGSALGASIQSVALYRVSGADTPTILLDNIIACKATSSADALNLRSLVGKNTASEPWWFTIESVSGTTLVLGGQPGANLNASRAFRGTSESVATYRREQFLVDTPGASAGDSTASHLVNDSGSVAGGYITFSGGWNETDMSTQTGETWYDGVNGLAMGLQIAQAYCIIEKLGFARYYYGWVPTGTRNIFRNVSAAGCGRFGVGFGLCYSNIWEDVLSCNNAQDGLNVLGANHYFKNVNLYGSQSTYGITWSAMDMKMFGTNRNMNNGAYGIRFTNNTFAPTGNYVYNCDFRYNASGSVQSDFGTHYFVNCNMADSTEGAFVNQLTGSRIHFQNGDQTANNHLIYTEVGRIQSDATVRHTASGISWKFMPTVATNVEFPLRMTAGKVYFLTGRTCTVKLWMRRSNTGLTGRVIIRGGQLGGPSTDQIASISAAADTWEELTLSWTSASTGVVEIEVEFYGGTTYSGYIDDMTVTSA